MQTQHSSLFNSWTAGAIFKFVALVFCCALLIGSALAQSKLEPGKDAFNSVDQIKVAEAIDKLDKGSFEEPMSESFYVERIAEARAIEAIPTLELRFTLTRDAVARDHIASALLRLGDRKDIYWDYLVAEVTPALETDFPSPVRDDLQKGPSDDFIAWAKGRNESADSALKALYRLSSKVLLMAETEDPRSIPMLRRALLSNYFLIQAFAAKGLAQMQDKDSIPLIIQACHKSPTSAAGTIAQSLVFFDDPRAQEAVDAYVPKEVSKALLAARVQGLKPLN